MSTDLGESSLAAAPENKSTTSRKDIAIRQDTKSRYSYPDGAIYAKSMITSSCVFIYNPEYGLKCGAGVPAKRMLPIGEK
jgi:hypothetical protein